MKFQRLFAMTAVAAFALSTLTGCPWEQEGDAPSAPSSSSSRPSHDHDDSTDDSDPDTPSSTPDEPEEEQGFTYDADANCYTITSSEGLINWAKQENIMTADCTLTDNIEMSSWDGLKNYDTPYTGTFDGNGKTISGLGAPLFGEIGSGGTVKNLTIDGTIYGDCGVASSNSGTIANCTIKAAVHATGSSAGGITHSNMSSGEIIGCVVTGNVSGLGSAGGIAANNRGIITGCMVTGNVSSSNYYAGGIVAHGTADTCYYSGTVTPGQGESVNNIGTRVSGEITWKDAIEEMNKHLTDCEYVFELDTNKQPILVKKSSAEQAVNRLLAQFWG